MTLVLSQVVVGYSQDIQGDSKRWTEFRTSIFPELHMVRELST